MGQRFTKNSIPWNKGLKIETDLTKHPKEDLTGKKFNKLTVLGFSRRKKTPKGQTMILWNCQCDCGKICEIKGISIKNGHTKSCGCIKSESHIGIGVLPDNLSSKRSVFNTYIGTAKDRNLFFGLSFEEFVEFLDKNCFYCGKPPSNLKLSKNGNVYKYNGIDRVNNAQGYILENCVPCCHNCNWCKKDFTQDEFFNHIRSIYEKHFK